MNNYHYEIKYWIKSLTGQIRRDKIAVKNLETELEKYLELKDSLDKTFKLYSFDTLSTEYAVLLRRYIDRIKLRIDINSTKLKSWERLIH